MNKVEPAATTDKAATDALTPAARQEFLTLKRLPSICDFALAFQNATGIPLKLTPPWSGFRDPRPEVRYLAVPMIIDGHHAATFVGGPVLCLADGESPPATNGALPVVNQTRLSGLERLISVFAQRIPCCLNRELLAARKDEPACVTGARKFIRRYAREEISTRDVAEDAGVSLQHLSKLFGNHAGMTLSEYIMRVRVELAKVQLLDNTQRISEVAFGCGFQSIPNFNRVFKTHTGLSPTQYRETQRKPDRPPATNPKVSSRDSAKQNRTGE